VLHADLVATTTAVLRFEREVEVIRRIRHPNVVDIFEAGTLEDGRPFFVMELLSGVSLEAFVRVRKRLPAPDVLGILEPLCRTLAVCHEQSVIHRDLKASNIFLAETATGERRVTLLDFGVAKLIDDSAPGLTAPSRIVGTPTCMAPEQIRGEPATARTDIYALGVLTYFMLTGELPFKDPSFMLMQSMHLYVNPEKPSTVAPVSAAFDEVVLRAMAKSPDNRYASTLEMLEAFRAALESERRPRDTRQGSGDGAPRGGGREPRRPRAARRGALHRYGGRPPYRGAGARQPRLQHHLVGRQPDDIGVKSA
jgi:serine/threonine-protein kinase